MAAPPCRRSRWQPGQRRAERGAATKKAMASSSLAAVLLLLSFFSLLASLGSARAEPQLLAAVTLKYKGPGVSKSDVFIQDLDDAIAETTKWISIDDFSPFKVVQFGPCAEVDKQVVGNMLSPSPAPSSSSSSPENATATAPSAPRSSSGGGGRRRLEGERSLLAAAKQPPPATAAPPGPDDSCKALVASFSLSPLYVPSPKQFQELPDAVSSGAVAADLRRRGYAVQSVSIVDLKVDNALLESSAAAGAVGGGANKTATNFPAGATGREAVKFTLRLMGPDAVLGNGGLLRVLMRDGIAAQVATGSKDRSSGGGGGGNGGGSAPVDAVSVANARIVNVREIRAPADAGSRRRRNRSRRSLLLLEGAPPAGSPERAAAVAKASAETAADAAAIKAAAAAVTAAAAAAAASSNATTANSRPSPAQSLPSSAPRSSAAASTTAPLPYQFDYAAATEPAIDVTFEITHLAPEGVKRVYSDVNALSETNQFTNLLKAAGYRIDSVRAAPVPGWFSVDGKPYGSRSSLVEMAKGGDARPLARAIVIPILVVGILAVAVCFLCSLRRRQQRADARAGVYYKSAGWWPRFLGGRSLPRSTGLDAAVAAAVRKAEGPVSAAELLLRDIESGGKAAALSSGGSTGGRGIPSGGLHGAFAAAGGGDSGDGGSGSRSGSAALAPSDRTYSAADGGAASTPTAACGFDDDPYGRLARGWQLDPASLQILTKPDGSEWELGSGTSGRVYKALYNGVQEVAVKVFNEALPSLAALAEEEEEREGVNSASDEAGGGGKKGGAAGGGGGGGLLKLSIGGALGRRKSSTTNTGGSRSSPAAAGLRKVLRSAMTFRGIHSSRSGTGGSGAASASGDGGEATAAAAAAAVARAGAEDESGKAAAAAVVSPPSSLATEAPATNSSSSTTAKAAAAATTTTDAAAAAADVTSAPAGGGLETAGNKGGGTAFSSALSKKPPQPLSKQRAAAKQQLEDLAREVLLLRACHDRNVVSFVGASVQSGHAVLVTEFMPNGDLYSAIRDDGIGRFAWTRKPGPSGRPLPNTGINRRIALDIARGLHFLHSRRVVHLDLKSPNILLARDFTAKVADVGLSKILRDRFLSTMQAVGTFAWAAPEVLLGKPTAESADIYSFGVLLWELSTAEPPPGRALREIEVPEEAPREVAALIARCMDEDPTKRPTALELVHFFKDLKEANGGATGSGSGGVSTAASASVSGGGGRGESLLGKRSSSRVGGESRKGGSGAGRQDSSAKEAARAAVAAADAAEAPAEEGGGAGGKPTLAKRLSKKFSKSLSLKGSKDKEPFDGGRAATPPPPPAPPAPPARPQLPNPFGGGGGGGGATAAAPPAASAAPAASAPVAAPAATTTATAAAAAAAAAAAPAAAPRAAVASPFESPFAGSAGGPPTGTFGDGSTAK